MRRLAFTVVAGLTAACAGGGATSAPAPTPAPAPAPAPAPTAAAPAATTVMRQAAQTAQTETARPRAADPTGEYAVSLAYQGQSVTVTFQLAKDANGGWTGRILADQVPPIALYDVRRTGDTFTASATAPDGSALALEFTVTGDDMSGQYKSASGDGSTLTGKRIKG